MHGASFTDLSLVIAFGVAVSLIMRIIRQPMIIGYILTGILVGPAFLDLIKIESIEIFAQFGIALLLMIVGLGLNPRVIREVGRIAAMIGLVKVLTATVVGFGIGRLFDYSPLTSLYIGLSLSFSSTIIILKLLSDKKEQTRLYGKVAVGFLLVEDLIATLVLIAVSASASQGGLTVGTFGLLFAKSVLLVSALVIMRSVILPQLNRFIANSQEFLFLFAIGWGLGIATVFKHAGFSLEIGALCAGVALASLPYAQEVASRLKPLRDFFIVLFFISLGSHLVTQDIVTVLPLALLLSAIVLVGNPLVAMIVMGLAGYTKKTSFKAGIAGAQISEFSFILLLLANQLKQIDTEVLSLITVVALITIGVSTYVIIYADQLYMMFEKYLSLFERKNVHTEQAASERYELVLFGYHKGGGEFLRAFRQLKKSYVVVDYDPVAIENLENRHIHHIYGDATDLELLGEIRLEHAKLVVSTITDHPTNHFLLKWLSNNNPRAVYICMADTIEQAAELYSEGAAYVMLPHYIGSEKIGAFIRRSGLKKSEFRKYRERHLAYLQSHYSDGTAS